MLSRRIAIPLAVLLMPGFAAAASSSSVGSIGCGGDLSLSFAAGASLQCSGDLSLSGGSLISDSSVILRSAGGLALGNLTIDAPLVEIDIQGPLSFTGGVHIDASSIVFNNPLAQVPSIVPPGASPAPVWDPSNPPLSGGGTLSINWQSFDISSGDPVHFNQGSGITVVSGGNGVLINGTLTGPLSLQDGGYYSGTDTGNLVVISGATVYQRNDLTISPVPEPSSLAMMVAALGLLALRRRKA